MVISKIVRVKQCVFNHSKFSEINFIVMQNLENVEFVCIKCFFVLDVLEMGNIAFVFVGNAVMHE